MTSHKSLTAADIVRLVQSYYDAVDSMDSDRLADTYFKGPSSTVQFNANEPIIVTAKSLRDFSAPLSGILTTIKHTMIEVWMTPLMGGIVPVDLLPGRPPSSITVVSTALPSYTIDEGGSTKVISLPATSIFTIDIASGKFISVHNMFDFDKVFAAVAAVAAKAAK